MVLEVSKGTDTRFIVLPGVASHQRPLWDRNRSSITYTLLSGFDTYIPDDWGDDYETHSPIDTELPKLYGNCSDVNQIISANSVAKISHPFCDCPGSFVRPCNVNAFINKNSSDVWVTNTTNPFYNPQYVGEIDSVLDWKIKHAFVIAPDSNEGALRPQLMQTQKHIHLSLEQVTWSIRDPRLKRGYCEIKLVDKNAVDAQNPTGGILAFPMNWLTSIDSNGLNGVYIEPLNLASPLFNYIAIDENEALIFKPKPTSGTKDKSVDNIYSLNNDHLVMNDLFNRFFF